MKIRNTWTAYTKVPTRMLIAKTGSATTSQSTLNYLQSSVLRRLVAQNKTDTRRNRSVIWPIVAPLVAVKAKPRLANLQLTWLSWGKEKTLDSICSVYINQLSSKKPDKSTSPWCKRQRNRRRAHTWSCHPRWSLFCTRSYHTNP